MSFVFEMMNSAFEMMKSALKMMKSQRQADGHAAGGSDLLHRPARERLH